MTPMHLAPAGAAANNHFACELYAQLVRPEENLCFSPFSIAAALSMVHAGARGRTAREIESVLHAPEGEPLQPPRYEDPVARGEPQPRFLQQANALWADADYPLRPQYVRLLAEKYEAEIRGVDFVHESEPVRRIINDWVSRKTNGRIQRLLDAPLHPLTRLVLTNAVYFLSKWSGPFDPLLTRREPFMVRPGAPVEVQMMHRTLHTRFIQAQTYRGAELRYEDGPSMWVLLPEAGRTLADAEAALGADALAEQWRAAPSRSVVLSMPRFHVRSRFDLVDALARLGVSEAFSDRADFSGIHEPRPDPLQLSSVIHEAFTDVNEARTEAGAATAMLMRAGGIARPEPVVELRLDRPFLFIIRDSMPGAILFMGRVVDPIRD